MKYETCLECGNEIGKYGKKFCSRRCSGLYNNRNCENLRSARKGPLPKVIRNKNCIWCRKSLIRGGYYCSRECQRLYIRNQRVERWMNGDLSAVTVKDGLSRVIREYLLEINEYKCSRCGWGEINEFSGKVPLEIDHKDGNPYNNTFKNLDVLCPNCHSLTEFHKGLNGHNGKRSHQRKYFKKRYERDSQKDNYMIYNLEWEKREE